MFVPPASAERVWDAILQAGEARGRRCRPGSARATRCGSKRRCVSTATTWTRRRRWSKRTSAGSSAGRRTTFIGADVLRRQKADGAPRKLVGFEMLERAIGRHGYDVYRRRREGRRRDQRHADAVPEEGDRHGVPAGRPQRSRARSSRSTSAAGGHGRAVVPMPFYKRAK